MVLGLTMLQHFELDNYSGFHILELVLFFGAIAIFVSAFVIGIIGDLNRRRVFISMISSIVLGVIMLIGSMAMFLITISWSDVYKLKTENIVEITPLTNDYKLTLESGKVIYANKSEVRINESKNNMNYGTAVIKEKRPGITDHNVKIFNEHTNDWMDSMLKIEIDKALRPEIALSKSDQSQFANLKYKQTMKLEH